MSLLGTIQSQSAILIAERAAFATDDSHLFTFSTSLSRIQNLGANDIYSWFLASSSNGGGAEDQPPDLKLNLIYPCTEQHVKKYEKQGLRIVHETPEIYSKHIRPYLQRKREEGRLNWVFNIIEGRTEQEDVIYREHGDEGFLLLPDLNWDRKTMSSLHLLGIVERRDIWSVRDLQKKNVDWIKHMAEKLLSATVKLYPELEKDQLKLYVHCKSTCSSLQLVTQQLILPPDQPTYYHFHIHIVHVSLEAGSTQATGKALGLENIISQLETMQGGKEAGMADVSLSYHVGEQSELWEKIWLPIKEGLDIALG